MNAVDAINEEWVKKKLNIETDNLEDFKSLSLPGTYHEKIICLGDALHRFTRLKELDLSRNSICSLEGLENLRHLEKLNLYYNNVCSLKELDRLHKNKNLVELDLRLNPIAKEEIDYRLYLINLLPSLKILDDREIRDSEKQMAYTYYGGAFRKSASNGVNNEPTRHAKVSRVKSVTNMIKRSAGIKDTKNHDDDNLTNIQNFYTGNTEVKTELKTSQPTFEQYSPRSLKKLGEQESQMYAREHIEQRASRTDQTVPSRRRSTSLQEVSQDFEENRNLLFDDEYEAYSVFKSRGTFTPNPRKKIHGTVKIENTQNQRNVNQRDNEDVDDDDDVVVKEEPIDDLSNPIFPLLDLVDRYWNGTKSLHKSYKFLGLANQLLTQYTKYSQNNDQAYHDNELVSLKNIIKNLQEENFKLNQKFTDTESKLQDNANNYNVKLYLNEIESLKKKLHNSQEENKKLKKEYNEVSDKLYENIALDSIENQNDVMKKEVEIMRIKLKQYEQMQNLTEMLQESHKSLVTTNEHLLREIHDQKFKMNLFTTQNDLNAEGNNRTSSQRRSNNNNNNDQYKTTSFNRNLFTK